MVTIVNIVDILVTVITMTECNLIINNHIYNIDYDYNFSTSEHFIFLISQEKNFNLIKELTITAFEKAVLEIDKKQYELKDLELIFKPLVSRISIIITKEKEWII